MGFFLGLFPLTSKCNFLSGEIMNAKKSREETKCKSFVTYSCSAAAAMRILSFLTLFSLGASQMTKEKAHHWQ
jgi:hypothetical protein